MKKSDVVIIGGGPAGLAAAVSCKKEGAKVILIEREEKLGGILKQCIHDGFGLIRFKEKLSGPEYAQRYIDFLENEKIEALTSTYVSNIKKNEEGFLLTLIQSSGIDYLQTKAIVLATGCREKTAKQVNIHGTRPAGVFTAGNAQNYVNLLGQKIGKRVVILGSGDIGLIMARRLTLEGAKVLGVYEIMPVPSGLPRNISQCLNDYNIPLHLSTTVTRVYGAKRVQAVEVGEVDERFNVIENSRKRIECDTLIVSVGLIPENEIAKKLGVEIDPKTRGPFLDTNGQTSVEGVFACGNCFHVFDLVDRVSANGEQVGKAAARYCAQKFEKTPWQQVVIPAKKAIDPNKLTCIGCPNSCELSVKRNGEEIAVEGNRCPKGIDFATAELKHPMRSLTSTMKTGWGMMCPVRSDGEFARERIPDVMKQINAMTIEHDVNVGDILIENVCGLNINIIACARMKEK